MNREQNDWVIFLKQLKIGRASCRERESMKAYAERYQEMFNETDGDFDEVAIKTFKVGLSFEHGLRKYLPGKPITSYAS